MVEEVDAWVDGEQRVGNPRPFVVAGDHHHRHPPVGHRHQWLEGPLHQLRPHPAAEQHVAAVDHEVGLAGQRRRQGALEVGEKIRAPAPPHHPRPHRQVEAEVGVGEEQDAEQAHRSILASSAARPPAPITRALVKRSQRPPGGEGEAVVREFVYAGIMTYEKIDGCRMKVASVSTFERADHGMV